MSNNTKVVDHPVCFHCGGELMLDLENAVGEYTSASAKCFVCYRITTVKPIIKFEISKRVLLT